MLLLRGLEHGDEDGSALDVVGDILGLAIALGAAALAGGVLLEQRWLLAFWLVFLLEEIYETGVLIMVVRAASHTRRSNAVDLASRA